MSLHPRYLQPKIEAALKDTPVVCILGPRQVGKSTLSQQLAPKRAYLTFDDDAILFAARQDPTGFVQGLPEYVTLDEVQRVPELLRAIKAEVDRNRAPGRFLLTGSANLLLLPKVKESLAGRVEIFYLQPLTEAEKNHHKSDFLPCLLAQKIKPSISQTQAAIEDVAERLCAGGYPEPNTRTSARARAWYIQYLKTIIQNDVKDIAAVRDEDVLQLSHYRDKDQVEVDLVIEQGQNVWGIEVKKAASIQPKDGEGLQRLATQAGSNFKGGALIYCGNNCLSLKIPNCYAVPISWLW